MSNTQTKAYKHNPLYTIHCDGRVFSGITNRFLKPATVKGGYSFVALPDSHGVYRTKYIHVLVAEYWLENPGNLPEVNHKDEDTSNNHVDNLEWCTRQYNIEYSQAKDFEIINPNGELIVFRNLQKFCRENKLSAGNLHSVIRGSRKQHKGWTNPSSNK